MKWILILVMISPTTPHFLTIPVETFESEVRCNEELRTVTEQAQDKSGQAILVCLKDVRQEGIPEYLRPPVLDHDEPIIGPENFKEKIDRPERLEPKMDDSMIIVKAMDIKLEPGLIMKGA
tara:strand:+ start:1536 stop:1898 length:363 start_codon:yes stop_codon:yes gene_type:complete